MVGMVGMVKMVRMAKYSTASAVAGQAAFPYAHGGGPLRRGGGLQ